MKNKITILSILIYSATFSNAQTRRVLFLGNSYTYVNNLPQMIADMAASMGDVLIYDSNAPGGYYLGDHLTNTTSVNKIMIGNWDYVVLQDQSMAYAYTSTFMNMIPYAYKLDSIIKAFNSCGQTMFYMTWGRKNGDTYLCSPPECTTDTWINRTYYEMDSTIQLNYMFAADSLNTLASPVGAVWRYIRRNFPAIELFQTDESHPSEAGTYAAACCFYTALFRKDPTLISFNAGLSAPDAANIRNAAGLILYDSLLNWHIGEYDSLINVACPVNGINEISKNLLWNIYPNPGKSILTIKFTDDNSKKQIQIYNTIGLLIKEIEASPTTQIEIADLPVGLYFIRLKNYSQMTLKFIKQ